MELSKTRILLVCNDGEFTLSIWNWLNEAGKNYILHSCQTLGECINYIQVSHQDILILDLRVLKDEGIQRFLNLYEASPLVPIILLTDSATEELAESCISIGAKFTLKMNLLDQEKLVLAITAFTQNNRLERERTDSNQKYHSLFDANPIATWIYDADTLAFVMVNEAATKEYGYTLEEFLTMKITDIESEGATYPEAIPLDESERETISGVWRHRRKDGSMIYVEMAVRSIRQKSTQNLRLVITKNITTRLMAQKKLTESETRYRRLFEAAKDGIIILDYHTGNINNLNPFFESLSGYSFNDVFGENFWGLGIFKQIPEKNFTFSEIRNNEFLRISDIPMVRKDRELRYVEFISTIYSDEEQMVIQCNIRDTTERIKIEGVLRANQKLLSMVVEHMPVGILILDKNGQIIHTNSINERIWEGILDLRNGDYQVHRGWFLDTGQPIGENEWTGIRILKTGLPVPNEEILVEGFDGTRKIISNSGVPIFDTDKNLIGVVVVNQDITERKNAEFEINRLSTAVRQAPVSIMVTNIEGRIEFVNSAFEELTGYSSYEVVHENPRLLKSGKTPVSVYAEMWSTIVSGNTWRGELLNKKKNGELFWEDATLTPIKDRNQAIIQFMAIKIDITEKKNMLLDLISAKEKAEEMNNLKTIFLENMSHELRTPMIGILGFSEELSQYTAEPFIQEIAQIINQSGQRLLTTLDLILNLSTLEAGLQPLNITKINIIEIVQQTVKIFSASAVNKSISLKFSSPLALLELELDEKLFQDVMVNLISNAVKYTSKGGVSVEVTTENVGESQWAVIVVQDTGIGIEKEKQSIIWEEFRQVSEGQSRNYEGTGLGLSVTKRFVEKMNGIITVTSELGAGAKFVIRFPINMERTSTRPEEYELFSHTTDKVTDENGSKPNILYVEDDPVAIKLTERMLHDVCAIHSVTNFDDAMKCVNTDEYSAILMDINLGQEGYGGIETTKQIRKLRNYKNTPIIAVTAYALPGDKERFLKSGCSHYIAKPFNKAGLHNILREAAIIR